MLERSTQRGCCRFTTVNRGGRAARYFLGRSRLFWAIAVLIYMFRDEGTPNLAFTIDVTGLNLPTERT